MRMRIKLLDEDNILILHHWDCDGICSSVLLAKHLKEINSKVNINFFIPKIGNYFLDSRDYRTMTDNNLDTLFIVDMALPKKDFLRLKKHISNV